MFGIGEYSMRIWLDPELMRQRSLTPTDVINAIQKQNAKVTAGQIGMPPTPAGQAFQLTVNVEGALADAAEFEQIIVKSSTEMGGQITRVRDIGRVELGAQTYSQFFKMNGRPAGGIAIYQLPEANALDTAKVVSAALKGYAKNFPQGIRYSIPLDTTAVRAGVGQRGLSHPLRSGHARAAGHHGLPPGLARDAGAGDDGAGDHRRRLCGHGRAGFHASTC